MSNKFKPDNLSNKLRDYFPFILVALIPLCIMFYNLIYKNYGCETCICRPLNNAVFPSKELVVNDTIFDIKNNGKGVMYLLFKDCRGGFVFGDLHSDSVDDEVREQIVLGETIVIKHKNDKRVFFVNKNDTIVVQFTKENSRGIYTDIVRVK
ncbi:hypothetical protein [Fluviicola sp.]|uniref:hypothetical protein n=1 Tax=Fluviicola sp. TaxID=1917219 RepID=UPI003D2A49A9